MRQSAAGQPSLNRILEVRSDSSPSSTIATELTPSNADTNFEMQSFSLPKVLIIAAIAVALAGVGMYVFKKNLPGEIIPILTNDELAAAGLYVELYENPRTGFTMNTPVGWTLDESGALGAFVVFVSPTPDLQGSISFSPSITIIGEEANYLEDYVRKTKAAIPLTLEDFRVTENRKVSLGGTE